MLYVWLGIIVLLALVEVMTVNLTTIWFVVSGIVALFVSTMTDNFLLQFGVFTIGGVLLLILTRPLVNKWLEKHKPKIRTNIDRVIGMDGVVTEEIKPNVTGEVKVDGKRWSAYADTVITVDSTVQVLEINGVKLKVKKVGE